MDGSERPIAVIAGASGFIGKAVSAALADEGYEIRTIGRSAEARWDDPHSLRRAVDGAEILINFAGKSVNCRYTDANRDEILRSRVDTTRALHEAVGSAANPPRIWMNASTATIYRHSTDRPNTESDGRIGEGFSVDVATAWERELFVGALPRTRRVALRMAIVLGDGPATRMLLSLARLGLGGTQFDGWCPPHRRYRGIGARPTGPTRVPWYRTHGRQKFSWVHVDDVVRAILFIRDDARLDGPINIASAHPTDNRTLMRTLRRVVGAPIGVPTFRWMLEIGMWALRTESELILKSRWVLPETLTEAGFAFAHPDLEAALRDVRSREHAR
ncbi:epimerase [uncultured Microbacterium sp.]|uniref:epimerase n=1 Tax=uncultured Microbacterium sp. TaxID=191216 RepID=UPI0035CA87DA